MERPSHSISTLLSQSGSRRFGGFGIAVFAQLSFAAVLVGGIVDRIAKEPPPPPLQFADVKEPNDRPPPPPIKAEKPQMPTAVIPLIDIAPPESGGTSITMAPPQPQQSQQAQPARQQQPPPPVVPDRAPVAIPQTHTVPPYPTLARRLGAEGKVTLRLTVLADGSVGKAEVVTSSGRVDLDQAAAAWITGHWTYKPAIRGGVPAPGEVLAAVQFNLSTSP